MSGLDPFAPFKTQRELDRKGAFIKSLAMGVVFIYSCRENKSFINHFKPQPAPTVPEIKTSHLSFSHSIPPFFLIIYLFSLSLSLIFSLLSISVPLYHPLFVCPPLIGQLFPAEFQHAAVVLPAAHSQSSDKDFNVNICPLMKWLFSRSGGHVSFSALSSSSVIVVALGCS